MYPKNKKENSIKIDWCKKWVVVPRYVERYEVLTKYIGSVVYLST